MTSDEIFEFALAVVLESEGGYVWDKNDPGGETNWGISKRSYPHLNIADLTLDEAKAIYKADYWNAISGDILPAALAVVSLDIAVNHGPGRLHEWLGEAPHDAVSLSERRLEHYISLSTWSTYSKGWSRRVFRTLRAAQMLEVRAKAEAETLLS